MRHRVKKGVFCEYARRRRGKSEKQEENPIRRTVQEIQTGRRTGLSADLEGSRDAVWTSPRRAQHMFPPFDWVLLVAAILKSRQPGFAWPRAWDRNVFLDSGADLSGAD